MGAWGEGLFDNDGALDALYELVGEETPPDAPRAARDPALTRILGTYRSELDGMLAARVPEGLVERCIATLDALDEPNDLYGLDGTLAALGLLLLVPRPTLPPGRLARWRARFRAIDAATTSERGFWDEYAAKVYAAFERLEAR